MSKINKLRICDWSLLILTIAMLASSIQLEGWWFGMNFIWLHLAFGLIFFVFIGWHLQLHFNRQNWISSLSREKSIVTKWLAVFGAFTLLTALVSTVHMFITWHHSAVGGWHGIIGFVFIALAICHIIRRLKFYS